MHLNSILLKTFNNKVQFYVKQMYSWVRAPLLLLLARVVLFSVPRRYPCIEVSLLFYVSIIIFYRETADNKFYDSHNR